MTATPAPGPTSQRIYDGIESSIYWIAVRWLMVFNVGALIYVGLPFIAPVFMQLGLEWPARAIYTLYSPLCHQFGYRTFYLFGDQFFYPAQQFAQLTGIDPYSTTGRFQAKAFLGNEFMGWKVAYCARDVAIYFGIFLAGLVYGLARQRGPVKPIHLVLYALIGILPIGLDGFSQLFSQPPFNLIPLRESSPELRVLTGSLFGIMSVWLAYPYVEETFEEIRQDIEYKRQQRLAPATDAAPDTPAAD